LRKIHLFFGRAGGRGQSSVIAGVASINERAATIDANQHNPSLSRYIDGAVKVGGDDLPPSIMIDKVMEEIVKAGKQGHRDIYVDLSPDLSSLFLDHISEGSCGLWRTIEEEAGARIYLYHLITPHTLHDAKETLSLLKRVSSCCQGDHPRIFFIQNEFFSPFGPQGDAEIVEVIEALAGTAASIRITYSAAAQRIVAQEITGKGKSPKAVRETIGGIYRGRIDEHIRSLEAIIALVPESEETPASSGASSGGGGGEAPRDGMEEIIEEESGVETAAPNDLLPEEDEEDEEEIIEEEDGVIVDEWQEPGVDDDYEDDARVAERVYDIQ
jgi:hypothetical protein